MHFDASARLVVPDDVDLPGNETDLELAHAVEVDDLLAVNEPLLHGHGGLLSL